MLVGAPLISSEMWNGRITCVQSSSTFNVGGVCGKGLEASSHDASDPHEITAMHIFNRTLIYSARRLSSVSLSISESEPNGTIQL
jgi:hypothetical protein